MGVYLNPGKTNYQMAINSEIFVDKSEMILFINSLINTNQRFVSVSRPRRFGKTMAADMLCAYYDRKVDSRSMFEKLKIAKSTESNEKDKWDKYLGQFDVIRFVITDFMSGCKSVSEMIQFLTEEICDELLEAYPDIVIKNRINLHMVLNKIYAKTNRLFVIVIDEWDAIFRVWKDDKEGQKEYLDFI